MSALSASEIEVLREKALGSLYFFCRAVLGFDYMVPHVHGKVAALLESPARRKQVTLPRGFLKTTLCSVGYPLWRYLRNHDIRILIAMNVIDNAAKTVNQIRSIVEQNRTFRALFPEAIPNFRKVRWSDQAAEMPRSGNFREATFEAAGVGTTVTSRHYDLIIEDDLVAPKKDDLTGLEAMPTREEIEKAIGWHKLARSLLINPAEGEIINVGTRWSKYDLIQHIIDNEPHTQRLEMAVVDEQGNPTYPERYPPEVLEELQEEQGTYIYAAQYLNKPYDVARMVFQPDWVRYWEKRESLPPDMKMGLFVDPAISQKEDACNSVCAVCGVAEGQLFVLDYRKGHFNPSEIIEHMFELAALWGLRSVFPEIVAWQEALQHFFELECRKRGVWLNVEGVRPGPNESKDVRIRGLQPIAQRGDLLIARWMKDLEREMLDYPFGKYKDILDAIAYAPRVLGLSYSMRQQKQAEPLKPRTVGEVVEELRQRNAVRDNVYFLGYRSKIERLA